MVNFTRVVNVQVSLDTSPEGVIRKFYTELYQVITIGTNHDPSWFNPASALCATFGKWLSVRGYSLGTTYNLEQVFKSQWAERGLNRIFPFNPDKTAFLTERNTCSIYRNPRRLA